LAQNKLKRNVKMNFNQLFQLECGIQHYAWGARKHDDSPPYIAELLGRDAGSEPFAELWIGDHPKLPAMAMTVDGKKSLSDLIAAAPVEILGRPLTENNINELPFMLKVLDCESPLSIQAHPDKELAEKLHSRDPEHYSDANHKPEIAIGLRGMDALCQFRSVNRISEDMKRLDALSSYFADFLGPQGEALPKRKWLQNVYHCLFDLPQTQVEHLIEELTSELSHVASITEQDKWFMKLLEKYPGDRGTLNAYFLNAIHLNPGESIFLAAREPHAYLQGTIIECMANSDNVVRAGLTSKYIDTEVLINMLTYNDSSPQITKGETQREGERTYKVPAPEFQVEIYEHNQGFSAQYSADNAVSLMLVLEGSASFITSRGYEFSASRGTSWLWPADMDTCTISYKEDATKVVRARPNLDYFGPQS